MKPEGAARPGATGFGLVVIGDEVLNGDRADGHLAHFKGLLGARGHELAWHWLLPDHRPVLVDHLRFSMSRSEPVLVCGGIGATPDDLTRACAAEAAGVALQRHPEAERMIEERFGASAYPNRILMADLPAGCALVPNPVSGIPGFALHEHWFLPGFPQMAWPMAQWVLDTRFAAGGERLREMAVVIRGVPESSLVPLMRRLTGELRGAKLFSLPHLGEDPHILFGVRGHVGVDAAFRRLCAELTSENVPFDHAPPWRA